MTATDKIFTALFERGEQLTNKQMRARYGVKKPFNIIYNLRHNSGLNIEGSKVVDTKGRVSYKYRAVV